MYAIHRSLKLHPDIGSLRETFFVNQVGNAHKVTLHDKADFVVDDQFVFEIGGKNKNGDQIRGIDGSFLVIDDSKVGFGNKIPLYLFGLLY